MGTRAIISKARYCGLESESNVSRQGLYITQDGYPTALGREITQGRVRGFGSLSTLRCPHTAEQIADGAHDRDSVFNSENSTEWHYYQDNQGAWRVERYTGEDHSLQGWLYGNKGKPLPGA